jgi:L-lactate dehydrogenase complex protein LldG
MPVARGYRRAADASLERFAERLRDYHATVVHCPADAVAATVAGACADRGVRRLAIPPGLPQEWRPDGVALVEDHGLTAHELDGIDGAFTGCAAAIAETGTLILDGGATCGRRALTLVPDLHICVVRGEQLVALVPEGIAAVADAVIGEQRPITLVSGPSASSDIELTRVEGVHGPRQLLVVIAEALVR